MTETNEVVEAAQNSSAAPVEAEVKKEKVESASDAVEKAEKMLTQSEVNRIAARTKHEAYEKGKREAMAELERQQAEQTQTMGGQKQLDENDIKRLIEQEAEKKAQQALAQKIAGEFTGKLAAAKDKYEDFEDVISEIDLPSIPHVVQWANELDNTGDVIYDIAKNPSKFANLLTLSVTAPHLAQKELKRLSESIKKNDDAKQAQTAREPLSQLKPSTHSPDSGRLSVKELRNAPWLRG